VNEMNESCMHDVLTLINEQTEYLVIKYYLEK